jgi:hypothetical protein
MPRAALHLFTIKEGPYEENTLDRSVAAFYLFGGDCSKHQQFDHH